MSDSSITKGQRHVSFPAQPDVADDPAPDRLIPLDMILRFSEGRQYHVYLVKEPCSALVRELLTALTALCDFGGRINSPGRAATYTYSIRKFVRFLVDRSSSQECTLTVSDLTTQDLDTFEAYLRGQATREESISPYKLMIPIVRLLRWWRDTHPERVTASLQARLMYIVDGSMGHSIPRDGYSGQITDVLRAACLKDIPQVTERLTVLCDQKLAEGRDPEVHVWEDPHNVLWHIANFGVMQASPAERNRWYSERLHTQVFPTVRDLVPFLVYLALSTDIAIESLKDLRVDCLQNPANGTVEVRYCKRRAYSPRVENGACA